MLVVHCVIDVRQLFIRFFFCLKFYVHKVNIFCILYRLASLCRQTSMLCGKYYHFLHYSLQMEPKTPFFEFSQPELESVTSLSRNKRF